MKTNLVLVLNLTILMISGGTLGLVNGVSFEEDVTLTAWQKDSLDQFKDLVIGRVPEEYMKQDIYLIKWLRSSGFDLTLARTRLLRNVEWRKERGMDKIHSEDWSDVRREGFRYYIQGHDKEGKSYLFFDVSNMDLRKAIIQGKGERLLRYVDKAIDEGCNVVRERGEKYGNITRGHLLMNLDGYNRYQHGCVQCIPILLRILFSYLEHWPECVDQVIGVNAPVNVEQIVLLTRPFLDPVLRDSVHIYGINKQVWKTVLGKLFEFNQLPPVLGGTLIYNGTDADDYYDIEN